MHYVELILKIPMAIITKVTQIIDYQAEVVLIVTYQTISFQKGLVVAPLFNQFGSIS
jgi:hypothetical protein